MIFDHTLWNIDILILLMIYVRIYIYTHTPLDTFDAFLLGFRHNFMNRSIHQSIKPTMQNHDYWCSTFGDPQVGWVWTKSRRTSWSSLKHLVNNGRSDLSTINGCRVSAIHSSFKILIGLPSVLEKVDAGWFVFWRLDLKKDGNQTSARNVGSLFVALVTETDAYVTL